MSGYRGAAADLALRQDLAARPRLWTFDPQTFDLLRLNPAHPQPLRAFLARFFEGHFERGGRTSTTSCGCKRRA